MEFPFNIFATSEASDFKFGTQFGFSKVHHKITPREKNGRGHGLGELPIILEFPFNIFATAEASDFKFSMQFGLSKVHRKITLREKSERGPRQGKLPKFVVPF